MNGMAERLRRSYQSEGGLASAQFRFDTPSACALRGTSFFSLLLENVRIVKIDIIGVDQPSEFIL